MALTLNQDLTACVWVLLKTTEMVYEYTREYTHEYTYKNNHDYTHAYSH